MTDDLIDRVSNKRRSREIAFDQDDKSTMHSIEGHQKVTPRSPLCENWCHDVDLPDDSSVLGYRFLRFN